MTYQPCWRPDKWRPDNWNNPYSPNVHPYLYDVFEKGAEEMLRRLKEKPKEFYGYGSVE